MTRDELDEARAQAIRKYHRALEDNWEAALPRLQAELRALDEQYAAVKAASKAASPPEAAKPATTPRRARK